MITGAVQYMFLSDESAVIEQQLNELSRRYDIQLENPRYWHDLNTAIGERTAMMAVMLKLTTK